MEEVQAQLSAMRMKQQTDEERLKNAWRARDKKLWERIEDVIKFEEEKVRKKLEEEKRAIEEEERKKREERQKKEDEESEKATEEQRKKEEEEREREQAEFSRQQGDQEKQAEEQRKLLGLSTAAEDWAHGRRLLKVSHNNVLVGHQSTNFFFSPATQIGADCCSKKQQGDEGYVEQAPSTDHTQGRATHERSRGHASDSALLRFC